MLPAVQRAARTPGILSAGWYAGRPRPGWTWDTPAGGTLNLPLAGAYERVVRGVRRWIDPSRAVWFAPGEASRSHPGTDGEFRGLYVEVGPALLDELAPPPSIDLPAGPAVVRAAWDALEHAAAVPAEAEDTAVELLGAILAPAAPGGVVPRVVRDAQRWLSEDPAGAPGPTGLAAALGGSRFALCRQFRAATGRSVAGYREDLRLVAAVTALRDGERDLAALALRLGFASHSHFTLRFRRRLGVAPRSLRART